MTQTKSILLVDADRHESRELFTALVRAGHSVADTHRVDYALELLGDRSFEVVIVDVLSAREGIDDLMRILAEDWSNPLIVGVADFAALIDEKLTLPRGPHAFMPKPLDVQRLVEVVSADEPGRSTAKGVDIIDYLRGVMDTGKDVSMEVRDAQGNLCKLFVSSGSLVHAVSGTSEGEAALLASLAFEGGTFSPLPWSPPERESIQQPAESLLSRAAKMLAAGQAGTGNA